MNNIIIARVTSLLTHVLCWHSQPFRCLAASNTATVKVQTRHGAAGALDLMGVHCGSTICARRVFRSNLHQILSPDTPRSRQGDDGECIEMNCLGECSYDGGSWRRCFPEAVGHLTLRCNSKETFSAARHGITLFLLGWLFP